MKAKKPPVPVRVILCLLPPAVFLMCLIFREQLTALALRLPACPFHALTGFYCPACGNTRSVLALLQGDVLSALRFSVVPPLAALLAGLLYLELVLWCCGSRRQLLPRKGAFWAALGALLLFYFALRNFIPYLTP